MYVFLSGSYWQAIVWPRDSTKMALPCPKSTSIASGYVSNLKSAPRAKALGQGNRLLSQKGWRRVSVCSLCSALVCEERQGSSLPRTISWIVTVPWDPGAEAHLASRTKRSRDTRCIAVTETKSRDVKSGHQMCVKTPFQEILAFWSVEEEE